jgi:hypothetical protein
MMVLFRIIDGKKETYSLGLVWKPHFFKGFFIFPREINSFSLGKLEIPWENRDAKLTLNVEKTSPIWRRKNPQENRSIMCCSSTGYKGDYLYRQRR